MVIFHKNDTKLKNIKMLKNKTILITGGTGSFGKAFSKHLVSNFNFKKLIIFSRDELKQFDMQNEKIFKNNKKLRFFLGDIRDQDRLNVALNDVDIVIHAAALKQVLSSEYNPFETIKTNVIGAQNIINASINNNVKKVIALSTDKACSPINLYGASKLCAEKLFINANLMKGKKDILFSVLRYGNVNGSRGSVMPIFKQLSSKKKILPITNHNMTRFSIKMSEALEMVIWGLNNFKGGEILIPKIPSYNIVDLVEALKSKYKIIGIRQGEKLHEDLISKNESINSMIGNKYFILLRNNLDKELINHYKSKNFKLSNKEFIYNSGNNPHFLNISEIKKIFQHLDD